uniref:separase n=1 Tax=Hyaloperonospora arabidopsidis (strain Emoy2) TaxID=559515 RepID=M4B6W9_HYAAE
MKVGEVRQLLAAEGLSTDGSKKAMIERLNAVRTAAFSDDHRLPMKPSVNCFSAILILHHELQQFPWEGMDVMGHSSGVTRMPSLDLILQNAKCSRFVRRDRVQFLLNPAGDLRSTQHQLGPILADGATVYGWGGTVGEVPDPDELRNNLAASDLFIYCGHGSGEAYLPRDKVLGLQPNCSAALLFGCSSGRLEREGIFGPHGAVLAYLRAGSPAVLAMLWDVTDRDIDKLSVKILQDWLLANSEDRDGLSPRHPSLAKVLQDSRSVCKLKYLNGHAAICYANHRRALHRVTTHSGEWGHGAALLYAVEAVGCGRGCGASTDREADIITGCTRVCSHAGCDHVWTLRARTRYDDGLVYHI